jgi:hypothetical protein
MNLDDGSARPKYSLGLMDWVRLGVLIGLGIACLAGVGWALWQGHFLAALSILAGGLLAIAGRLGLGADLWFEPAGYVVLFLGLLVTFNSHRAFDGTLQSAQRNVGMLLAESPNLPVECRSLETERLAQVAREKCNAAGMVDLAGATKEFIKTVDLPAAAGTAVEGYDAVKEATGDRPRPGCALAAVELQRQCPSLFLTMDPSELDRLRQDAMAH